MKLWDDGGKLFGSRKSGPEWDTPRLLRHEEGKEASLGLSAADQEASILLLSDLGALVNIVQFLKVAAKDDSIATESQIAGLGRDVRDVMALVHSDATIQTIRADENTYNRLTDKLTTDLVRNVAVIPIRERIKHHPNADRLYQQVFDEYTHPKHSYRHALSLGDFHPGSVLMRQPTPGGDLTPVLLDWEFGTVNGRGVNGDIAQFLASFHCELIAAKDDPSLHDTLLLFTKNFCAAYRERSRLEVKEDAHDSNAQLLRSALSLHGREMINLANDEYCEHSQFQEMVDTGIWYLERVRDDAAEFVTDENWDELGNEDECLIQSLFQWP